MSTIINHGHMVRSDCNATETVMTSAIIDHQCKKKASKFIFSPSEKTSEGIRALNTPITEALFSKDQNNYFSYYFNAQSERNNEMNVSPTRNSSPTRASLFPLIKF